jgi:uncharacterized protein
MTEQAGPKDVFASMRRQWLNATSEFLSDDALADDVVIEMPFAPPGRPRRSGPRCRCGSRSAGTW